MNIKKLSLLLFLTFTLAGCWLDNTHADKLRNTERGGYIIVKNNGKYYRISPSGTRTEVQIRYRRR